MSKKSTIRKIVFVMGIIMIGTGHDVHSEVQYKAGKDVNFEEMLIQGQLKRPEISVVTGNVKQGADGLLRLRENFLDRMSSDNGEGSAE